MGEKTRYIGIVILASGALLSTLFAPPASATWGRGCQLGNEHHCYAETRWSMNGNGNGSGEEVMGLSSEIFTWAMLVPEYLSHDFVTNEQWMGDISGGWAEDGQIAGYASATEEGHEVNNDSLHWFYAFDISGEFSIFVSPSTVEGWQWHSYTEEDPGRNGNWCARLGATTVACRSGFAKYSPSVTVGEEAGTEMTPENAGEDRTGAEFTNGSWYHWGPAVNETRSYSGESEKGYMCTRNYEAYPGYIEWGTPYLKYPC